MYDGFKVEKVMISSAGILVNGMPKAGTNLVNSVLSLIPGVHERKNNTRLILNTGVLARLDNLQTMLLERLGQKTFVYGVDWPRKVLTSRLYRVLGRLQSNEYMQAHIPCSKEASEVIKETGTKFILILRDPRAVAISHMRYIMQSKVHFLHDTYQRMEDDHKRLYHSIVGLNPNNQDPFLLNIRERICSMMRWEDYFPGHTVYFEKLVGPKGGGSEDDQIREIIRLLEIVDITPTPELIEDISKNVFGVGATFRSGKVSGWKEEFSPEHIKAFKDTTGDQLQVLGYESDSDW